MLSFKESLYVQVVMLSISQPQSHLLLTTAVQSKSCHLPFKDKWGL